jgi:hypothetical protein
VTLPEFHNHYHEIVFRVQCHERKAADFQRFFEDIMVRHDPTFTPVKPHGNQGDWKNDGWIPASGTVFQCYAPEELDANQLVKKVRADFDGALAKWTGKMKAWTFVYAAQGKLPPFVVSLIEDLRSAHPDLTIDTWNHERLWQIVRNLSAEARSAILGAVPSVSEVITTTAEEIHVLLGYLARQQHTPSDSGTQLLDLIPKLDFNQLGVSTRGFIELGLPVAHTVADYLSRHPDPGFSSIISQSLAERYRTLRSEHPADSDHIFYSLIRWTQAGKPDDLHFFWAAVGIVAHYFELCDIFES